MFKVFRVIIIIRNHYFIILKLFLAIQNFILYQNKTHNSKIGKQLYNLWKFTDTSWIEELQTVKPFSPIWAFVYSLNWEPTMGDAYIDMNIETSDVNKAGNKSF